jgi:S1-C subfamily serine protease
MKSPIFNRVLLLFGMMFSASLSAQEMETPEDSSAREAAQVIEKKSAEPWETVLGTPADEEPNDPFSDDNSNKVEERETTRENHQARLLDLKKLQNVEAMVEKVIPRVSPCIVSIGETASGVIVKPSGIVITASHVTRKAGRILIVRLQDGRSVKGITLGSNAANDTSAIKLLGGGPWPYLKTVSPKFMAEAGQWCIAFGYPLSWPRDKPASARIGRITGQYRGKIVTDCPIMGGDSGGALVDLNGNLLGINSSVRLDVTQNLHVPIERYREDWNSMMTRQDVDVVTATVAAQSPDTPAPAKKPYLGIYGESAHQSVRIRDIRRQSPAEKAGLLPEDVIWQIDQTPIKSFAELLKYLATRKGGDQIKVGVNRFGVNLEIVVTLDAR